MFGIDITGWNKDRFKIYASLVSASYLKFQLDFLVDVSDSRGTGDDGQTLPKKATALSRLGARDYTLVKEFISVIYTDQQSNQPQLFQPKVNTKSMLDQLTLPSKYRPMETVPFDLLTPSEDRISVREIKEI